MPQELPCLGILTASFHHPSFDFVELVVDGFLLVIDWFLYVPKRSCDQHHTQTYILFLVVLPAKKIRHKYGAEINELKNIEKKIR